MADNSDLVLDVKNLKTVFFTNSGLFKAVDDVSFTVRRGETLAIVGESGCGKSVTALSLMRLVPDPPGRVVGGSVSLEGTDLLALTEASLSFLGLGIPEPYPSWGRMLSESAAEYVRTAPWLVIFPGLAISFVVFGVNLLGDALRDLLDPRQRS